ncbi:TIGR03984 family CRISPR-associated protein [candidate division KSB1 bacterium]|nr:TIGR03984 family CRISPR-associated protein [candidate division KSB1 bacterium]
MNNKNEALNIPNGLDLKTNFKSDATDHGEKDLPNLDSLNKFIKEKFKTAPDMAVCYFDYGIRFARWEKNALQFYNDKEELKIQYLLEARIFNQDTELKIWKSGEKFCYRLRQDNEGENCDVIEANQNLWGTQTENIDTVWTKIFEDRGTELVIPLNVTAVPGKSLPLVAIKTHNYIGELPNGQATYQDCRFVELVPITEDSEKTASEIQNN